jgi:hypothetical protein
MQKRVFMLPACLTLLVGLAVGGALELRKVPAIDSPEVLATQIGAGSCCDADAGYCPQTSGAACLVIANVCQTVNSDKDCSYCLGGPTATCEWTPCWWATCTLIVPGPCGDTQVASCMSTTRGCECVDGTTQPGCDDGFSCSAASSLCWF